MLFFLSLFVCLFFFPGNHALFFGRIICSKNPQLRANYATKLHNTFRHKFLMFQFIKLANLLWFYFNTKSSILKAKPQERKLYGRQINCEAGCFFLFQAVIFFESWHVLYKKTRAQAPMARCIKTPGMPWSLAIMFENTFCNEATAICCKNVLYLREKNFHASLKVIKKHS